ncbi:MAG: hypothetical protein S4CHLAM6_08400 [Chlamydiae bacterium]|nr:hypothetical protein [Chlamydiota bacterium]
MNSKPSYQITSHPIGSISEIWTISWPLILGLVCNGMMIVVDRLMLGKYSLEAMNASSIAGSAAFSFFVLPMVVAGISEVFVGRYHGLGQHNKMGSCAWQMIWFSIFMIPLFLLCGYIFGPYLFKSTPRADYALEYFYTIINFGSAFCVNQALMGFFIGQGKVRIITITVAFANLANIFLDYALIYGTPLTSSMGVKGAATATIISQFILIGALFLVFISKKNRSEKGTGKWKIKAGLFIRSLKIGIPASFAHLSEYICFFIFLKIMGKLGASYLTIAVLLNTVYMILYFIVEGISKGVTAICSNLIGASQHSYVKKHLIASFKLHAIFAAVVTVVLMFGSTSIFSAFIGEADNFLLTDPYFIKQMKIGGIYMCAAYLFDGMIWIVVGMLTAASDTRFIMCVGSLAPWVLLLMPVYLFSSNFNISESQVWLLMAIYCFFDLAIYLLRYRNGTWKKNHLMEDPSIPIQES